MDSNKSRLVFWMHPSAPLRGKDKYSHMLMVRGLREIDSMEPILNNTENNKILPVLVNESLAKP